MSHEAISVLWIGDSERSEFADAFLWLRENTKLVVATDVENALERIASTGCDPELIVVAQRWPGEFSPKQIERLRRAAPLARINELLGSWCEGETRTGRPAAGTLRNYWHQWLPRTAPQFARAARGQPPIWSLPSTATDDERLLAISDSHKVLPSDRPTRGLIAILLRNGVMARALCDAAPTHGYACVWLPNGRERYVSGVQAAVWDAPAQVESWPNRLAEIRRQWHGVPIVAIVNFPRIEDVVRLRAGGVAAVVSQPLLLDDLFWQIERVGRGESAAPT
jgi:hypothetical protein